MPLSNTRWPGPSAALGGLAWFLYRLGLLLYIEEDELTARRQPPAPVRFRALSLYM